ncbi:MAG: hypothetical protein WB611_03495 [Stellaceae bacterium]
MTILLGASGTGDGTRSDTFESSATILRDRPIEQCGVPECACRPRGGARIERCRYFGAIHPCRNSGLNVLGAIIVTGWNGAAAVVKTLLADRLGMASCRRSVDFAGNLIASGPTSQPCATIRSSCYFCRPDHPIGLIALNHDIATAIAVGTQPPFRRRLPT